MLTLEDIKNYFKNNYIKLIQIYICLLLVDVILGDKLFSNYKFDFILIGIKILYDLFLLNNKK